MTVLLLCIRSYVYVHIMHVLSIPILFIIIMSSAISYIGNNGSVLYISLDHVIFVDVEG